MSRRSACSSLSSSIGERFGCGCFAWSAASAFCSEGSGTVPASCAKEGDGKAAIASDARSHRLLNIRTLPCSDADARRIENALVIAKQDRLLRCRPDLREDRVPHVKDAKVRIDAGGRDIVGPEEEA